MIGLPSFSSPGFSVVVFLAAGFLVVWSFVHEATKDDDDGDF